MKANHKKTRERKPTSDAVEILHRLYFEDRPNRLASLEAERLNARIAAAVYELRTAAGLTQSQLAKHVGTTASVISRLEDADYNGHSLNMLKKIAAVFAGRIEIRFVPAEKSQRFLLSPEGTKIHLKEVIA